jgi:hypothetical protein
MKIVLCSEAYTLEDAILQKHQSVDGPAFLSVGQVRYILQIIVPAIALLLGDRTLQFSFGNKKTAQFYFLEYINRNQTVILDSHRPFICSVQYMYHICNNVVS